MADYLYHTYIYHNTSDVIGVVPADEAVKVTDFETNYKNLAVKIDDIIVNATTFENVVNYNAFKALIDGVNVLWGDVKYAKEAKAYDLYLITDSPL